MASDVDELSFRFDVGTYERTAVNAVVMLQFVLGASGALVGFGWLYFTTGFLFDDQTSPFALIGALPVAVGLLLAAYLLGKLYE